MAQASASARVERLRSVPLFEGLSRRALQEVAAAAKEIEAPAGQVLVEPRMKGSGMFVIEDGTVVVEKRGWKTELGPGEFFGELALLNSHGERTARVRAKTDVRCLAVARRDFVRLLEQDPKLGIAMLETLAGRLEQTT
jgi:CRP-like cAMP-binding protein